MLNQNEKLLKVFDLLGYVLVLLNIFLVPLFIDKQLLSAYIVAKQYLFIGLLLLNVLCFAMKTILSKKVHYRRSIIDVPLLIFLGTALISSLFSTNIYDSFLGRTEYFVLNFIFLFFLAIFYFIVVQVLHTPERWRGALDVMLAVGGLTAVLFITKTVFGFQLGFLDQIWNLVDSTNSSFGMWMIPLFVLAAGSLMKKNISIGRALFYFLVMITSVESILIMGFSFFWWVLLIGLILLLLLGVSFLQEVRLGWLSTLFALLIATSIFIIFGLVCASRQYSKVNRA